MIPSRRALSHSPVTLFLTSATLLVFAATGPATDASAFQTLPALMMGVLQHGTVWHLAMNVALLLLGGAGIEPAMGPTRVILLALVSAALGVLAELLFAGPGFVGVSGVAYGFVTCALMRSGTDAQRATRGLCIAAALALEWMFLRADLAVYTHIAGATTGAMFAMLSNLFGTKGPQLKPMKWEHVTKVLPIIHETDEDDAAEAERSFVEDGFENMFVLMDRGTVLGLTGFAMDDSVPDLAWLSWTYLAQAHMGQGLGNQMFNDLLGMLNKQGVRKIFIETSDYEEDGEKIYANAHRLYEEFGAGVELVVPDFHAPGEAKIIYGLNNPEATAAPFTPENNAPGLAITGVQQAPETDAVSDLRWEETPTGLSGVDFALNRVREHGHRMALLAIPSDISATQADGLVAQGFRHIGQLPDYYGPDVGQDWWAHDLAQ